MTNQCYRDVNNNVCYYIDVTCPVGIVYKPVSTTITAKDVKDLTIALLGVPDEDVYVEEKDGYFVIWVKKDSFPAGKNENDAVDGLEDGTNHAYLYAEPTPDSAQAILFSFVFLLFLLF